MNYVHDFIYSNLPRTAKIAIFLTFIYYLLYEWCFFFDAELYGDMFYQSVLFLKFIIPLVLLVLVGLPSPNFFYKNTTLSIYTLLYLALIVWSIIPTALYNTLEFVEVFKLIPRFIFFLVVIRLFRKYPEAIAVYSKFLIFIVVFSLIQLVAVYLFKPWINTSYSELRLLGPFGLFGKASALLGYSGLGINFPIVRLCGYWLEPSNASASAYAAFFLSRYFYGLTNRAIWRQTSFITLIAGVACLSNAGNLAFGMAILFREIILIFSNPSMRRIIIIFLGLFLVFMGIFGRGFVTTYFPNNIVLRIFVGAQQGTYTDVNSAIGGRLESAETSIAAVVDRPLGVGLMSAPGQVLASASAPILWLFLTGLPGLFFLLMRESIFFGYTINVVKKNLALMGLVQAWIVVCVQNMSYGVWMNPNYLILVAAVFASSSSARCAKKLATNSNTEFNKELLTL